LGATNNRADFDRHLRPCSDNKTNRTTLVTLKSAQCRYRRAAGTRRLHRPRNLSALRRIAAVFSTWLSILTSVNDDKTSRECPGAIPAFSQLFSGAWSTYSLNFTKHSHR